MTQVADQVLFYKMNGLGNDFIIFPDSQRVSFLNDAIIRRLADRDVGVGCDQLIVLSAMTPHRVRMSIFNADGGQVGACGNATRCVVRLVFEMFGHRTIEVETDAGYLLGTVLEQEERKDSEENYSVMVDMGRPQFGWQDIPLSHDVKNVLAVEDPLFQSFGLPAGATVSMGNPHVVFFVDDLARYDLSQFGALIEHHGLFPDRVNVTLAQPAQIDGHAGYKALVWERGVGLTQACGTAACAIGAIAFERGSTPHTIPITLPGGILDISRDTDGSILMSGGTAHEFRGLYNPQTGEVFKLNAAGLPQLLCSSVDDGKNV